MTTRQVNILHGNKALTVPKGSASNGVPIVSSTFIPGDQTQIFTYDPYTYNITYQGKCVGVSFGDTTPGSKVILWDCSPSSPDQSWAPLPQQNTVKNIVSNLCLDLTGNGPDGTQMQIWTCGAPTPNPNQVWKFVDVGGGPLPPAIPINPINPNTPGNFFKKYWYIFVIIGILILLAGGGFVAWRVFKK